MKSEMELKSFSHEEKVLVVEDDNALLHEMSFDFVDWLVRFLLRTGYMEIVQHKPDMMFTHKYMGRLMDKGVVKENG